MALSGVSSSVTCIGPNILLSSKSYFLSAHLN